MSTLTTANDERVYCPHKEQVEGYCKKCRTYLCHDCQMKSHYDHIQAIIGLDSVFTETIQEYNQLITTLDKQLAASKPRVHAGVVDEALAEVEGKVRAGYAKLTDEISQLEAENVEVIQRSPFLERLQREKEELEGEELARVEDFDRRLGETMSKLLMAITEENYEPVLPLLGDKTKTELLGEAHEFDPYYDRQQKFLKHLEVLKSVQPSVEYSGKTVEELIQVRGVHEEMPRLFVHSSRDNAVFVAVPATRSVFREEVFDAKLLPKAAQIVISDDLQLFICGGKEKYGRFSAAVYTFDTQENTVTAKRSMTTERARHGIAARGGCEVFVAGGENEKGSLCSSEMYDANSDVWRVLPEMSRPRKNPSLVVCSDTFLYVIGGTQDAPNEVEVLDLTHPTGWTTKRIEGLKEVRKAGALELGTDKVLIFGGKTGEEKLCSSIVVDLKRSVATMGTGLAAPDTFSRADKRRVGGSIYVEGNTKATMHVFDCGSEKWSIIADGPCLLKYNWE